MKPLNPEIGMYLLDKYQGTKREGLQNMWVYAWAWVEGQVKPRYMLPGNIPAVFEFAAILRVQAICTSDNPEQRQAFLFAASELLLPYA